MRKNYFLDFVCQVILDKLPDVADFVVFPDIEKGYLQIVRMLSRQFKALCLF